MYLEDMHPEDIDLFVQIAPEGCSGDWMTCGLASDPDTWQVVRHETTMCFAESADLESEILLVRLVEMSKQEFEALGEHTGW